MEGEIFIYQWNIEDVENKMEIKGFGIDDKGGNVCINVQGFSTWFVIEVQKEDGETDTSWTEEKKEIKKQIMELCKRIEISNSLQMIRRKRLYGYNQKTYPFIRVRFNTIEMRKRAFYSINEKRWTGIYGKRRRFVVHEQEASALLQMLCEYDLPSVGWIRGSEMKNAKREEYSVHIVNLRRHEGRNDVPRIRMMSFDIECYSTDPKRLPNAENAEDVIFQISCVSSTDHKKRLLTLGRVDHGIVGEEIIVREYETERELLIGFRREIIEYDPHIIMGYNIFGFDLPYIMERAKYHDCEDMMLRMGRYKEDLGRMQKITWSSTAYSYQEIYYIHLLGRIFVDMLPIIKRDYKFSNYRLKTVSTFFIGETKDPLTPKDIFAAYREYKERKERGGLSYCGRYCVQDSNLVLLLSEKLQTWIGLVEMARLCHVSIRVLYTQGQQVKVYSQMYKICMREDILVQNYRSIKDMTITTDGNLSGAYVFEPDPGLYDWVVPFDFSSLYPTTIIAYNIDYSTIVLDPSVPDEKCHVIDWREDEREYRYRFMREPIGIVPKLLKSLLDGRKEIKREMKKYSSGDTMYVVLDKRQLAYKVSANSAYGAMGVTKGYLPFMPGAMCTTAMGRKNIQKAADIVKAKYSGKIIYGDSVSGSTVLLLRNGKNEVYVMTIEQFYTKYSSVQYPELAKEGTDKCRAEVVDDIYVLSMSGWTKIRRVISHKTKKRMYHIYSSSCFIEVTEDHSLILENGELISPRDVIPGYHVLCRVKARELEEIELLRGRILMMSGKIFMRRDGMFAMKMDDYSDCMSIYLFLRVEYPNMIMIFEKDEIVFDVENKRGIEGGEIYRVDIMTPKRTEQVVYDIETEDGTFHAGIGDVIVKNTDSIYCHFSELEGAKEIWKTAKEIEYEIGDNVFPPPMKLLFEEKIYQRFLILTKKRYMAMTCDEKGTKDENLTSRGVLLARRDNCFWIRSLYERIVRQIMLKHTFTHIINDLYEQVFKLFTFQIENRPECFIISKLLGKEYKIRSLPEDAKKRRQRLLELEIDENAVDWKEQYEEKSKPAHVQLATRMKHRGFPVSCGTRIEYIILEDHLKKSKLVDKIEDPNYFWKHRDILRIDCFYYLKSLMKPIDQLLTIVFPIQTKNRIGGGGGTGGVLSVLYKYHHQHRLIMREIIGLPRFQFVS